MNENKEGAWDWIQCHWITDLAHNSNSKLLPDLMNNQSMNKCDPNFNIFAITIPTCSLHYSHRVDRRKSKETNSKSREGVEEHDCKSQFISESEHLPAID